MEQQIRQITNHLTDLLIAKNKAYGNTAQDPVNIFSKLGAEEAIKATLQKVGFKAESVA